MEYFITWENWWWLGKNTSSIYQYQHMRWLGFLPIKNFQQGSHRSKPFFVTRFKIARPTLLHSLPGGHLPSSLPWRRGWIDVNNGPVTWHPAWWVRQLSKRGNNALGQKNQDKWMARFLICSENPQKLQKLQFTDCWAWCGLDVYGDGARSAQQTTAS